MTVGQIVAQRARLVQVSAALTELAMMVGLFLAYKAVRFVAADNVDLAMGHALQVRHLEAILGMPDELDLQRWMLGIPQLPELVNVYYASVHFPATIAFLVWMYLARPLLYRTVRSVIIVMTAATLIVHLSYPLAPARMLTSFGFVDVGGIYGPDVYGSPANSFANQFAAMPSLHVGWSVLVAVGLVMVLRTRWRWLFLAHPVLTVFVVVSTGHHYWLDGIVAVVLVIMAYLVVAPGRVEPLPEQDAVEQSAAAT